MKTSPNTSKDEPKMTNAERDNWLFEQGYAKCLADVEKIIDKTFKKKWFNKPLGQFEVWDLRDELKQEIK